MSAGDFVDVRGWPRLAVGAAVEFSVITVDVAMEIAVACAMASAMGLCDVPLLAAAFCGSLWSFRGSPWKVHGSPWNIRGFPRNAVDMSVKCRGGPWTLPRSSAKKTNNVQVHPSCWVIRAERSKYKHTSKYML